MFVVVVVVVEVVVVVVVVGNLCFFRIIVPSGTRLFVSLLVIPSISEIKEDVVGVIWTRTSAMT